MYHDLSSRQIEILKYIKNEVKVKGYPPSVREIGKAVGLKSSSTVHGHLNILEKKGYLRRNPSTSRAIEIIDKSMGDQSSKEIINVPLVGRITAGQPILAVENIEDSFPISQDFIQTNNKLFSLKVFGESMIDAGIHDGDYLIVEKTNYAKNGDIVAALLGEEATIKRFYKENDHIRLQPENQFMDPIIVKDVKILGRVIGLFRKY
ncbi:MAG: transcriptional repressor LexA [Bacillota bacterium]|jgi:repressor LexA